MKKLMMMSLAALAVMAMMSCTNVKIGDKDWSLGNGHKNNTPTQVNAVATETAMQPFDEIDVTGPFNVILTPSDHHAVRIEGTAEQLEKMTIYVKDGELYIDHKTNVPSGTFNGLQVFVTSPSVKDIDITGSGSVTAPQALSSTEMNIDVTGSGQVTLAQLTCQKLDIDITGSGKVMTGPIHSNVVQTEITGSGKIDITGLTCKRLENEISGSGDMIFNDLNIEVVKSDISGSGDIYLNGTVGKSTKEVSGSGKVHVNEK